MTYDEFIEGINNPNKIKQVNFYIEGYNHYRNCSIGRYREKIGYPVNKTVDYRITCILTKDHSDDVSFPFKFKEDYKIFDFASKGKFTLKEVWDKVVITKVEYFESI